MVNSRLNLFTAALSGFPREEVHPTGAPLIPKLRGDFAEFLNEGYLDHLSVLHLPTCVGFGKGTRDLQGAFLGGLASGTRRLRASWHRTSGYAAPHLTRATPTCLPQDNHHLGSLSLPRPPIGQTEATWYRNINLLAIDYAFRPRLRSRLTLSRRTLLRKPWTIGGGDSHPSLVTHAGILTSGSSTTAFAPASQAPERSPTALSSSQLRRVA